MTLHFTVLASGSAGNASLLEAAGFGVLIDAGLGPRKLAARLEAVGASWNSVHAVLLTHLHADHWKERTLAHLGRRGIPLYCHATHADVLAEVSPSFAALRAAQLVRFYEAGESVDLHPPLRCRAIPLSHDGGVTCGFRFDGPADIFGQPCSLAYAADLGCWGPDLVQALCDVDVLALEFNHDVYLETTSGRAPRLIARILGHEGHLSNEQAASLVGEILRQSEAGRLQHLVQLHLSRDCNRPALARAAAAPLLADFPALRIHTARQDRPGPRLRLGEPARKTRSRSFRQKAAVRATSLQAWLPGWD